MRDYSKVAPQFWNGKTGKALKNAGPEALIVGLYLLTCQHANMIGMYYLSTGYIALDTGLGEKGATKGLLGACEAGFCSYDKDTEIVWVHEMAAYQIGEKLSPKDLRCKGIQKDYDQLPANPFTEAFFDRYAADFNLENRRSTNKGHASPLEAPTKPVAVTVAQTVTVSKTSAGAARFDEFWETWPQSERKQDKKKCREKWLTDKLDPLADKIFEDIAARKAGQKWSDPQYIEGPLVYLNNRRWEDGFTPMPAATKNGQWWTSDASVIAKGESLGLRARPGESMDSFKGRVSAAAGAHA